MGISIVYQGDVKRLESQSALSPPPGFGEAVIEPSLTYGGMTTGGNHTMMPADQAIWASLENAWRMRNDLLIMHPLECRQRLLTLLPWHLEAEGKRKEFEPLVTELTDLIKLIPDFLNFKWSLADAIWYGRAAVQFKWRKIRNFNGDERVVPGDPDAADERGWTPINGDKLVFKYDDGRPNFRDSGPIGIRVSGPGGMGDIQVPPKYRDRVQTAAWGMAYFLDRDEMNRILIHRHIIEDAPYELPQYASSIHGVGVRNRIYWTWYMMSRAMEQLMELIQRVGGGVKIYYYPAGNARARAEMEKAAAENKLQTTLIVPRVPGQENMYGVEMVEPSSAGITNLQNMVHLFFGHQILRYILGQTLSSEAEATGMGSGVADLHAETLRQIVMFDAIKLGETLTKLVRLLIKYNFPRYANVGVRFVFDVEKPEVEKQLAAFRQAFDMGAKIKADAVYGAIGMEKPDMNDEILQNPQFAQAEQQAAQQAATASPNPLDGPSLSEAIMGVFRQLKGAGIPA